ncbi:nucleolar protein 14-like isoform X2 [Dysidea avara]|uniref:nucleolar protein 14-like isoform X2 n=1 Tax=Dysidea avara TaxID=196820 RepID=UPI00332758B9
MMKNYLSKRRCCKDLHFKRRLDKSSMYNLESEELTHHGRSLYDLDDDDDDEVVTTTVAMDSEEDDTEEHFAGFLSKVPDRGDEEHPKSKKDIMTEIVANSKLQKFQKQEDHLVVDNLVSKVDSDWKEVQSFLPRAVSGKSVKSKLDPYDLAFQELLHEGKSKVSTQTSTEVVNDVLNVSTEDDVSLSTKLTRKEMDNAITVFQAKLKAEYQLFVKTKSWSHSQVTLFKMIRNLFSASTDDASIIHSVMFLMGKMLEEKCHHVNDCCDAVLCLLTCAEFIEFVTPSNQFVPEIVNFLCDLFTTSLIEAKDSEGFYDVISAAEDLCKAHREEERKFNEAGSIPPCIMCGVLEQLTSSSSVTKFSIRTAILRGCIILLTKLVSLYHRLCSFAEIFAPVSEAIESCSRKKLPKDVGEELNTLRSLIAEHSSQHKKILTMLKQNPKSIKFYEPKFDETYEVGNRRKIRNKKDGEMSKLKYKVKKERKGAIRELRKDNAFLAHQQLTEQLEKDAERKKRVQEIYSSLQIQQAEAKKEKRKK